METTVKTAAGNTYLSVDPQEYKKIISSPDVYRLDVRHTDEFEAGHIAGARNLDVMTDSFEAEALKILPKDKTIAVNCGSGKRSALASEKLADKGFKVVNLDGGITAWIQDGLPVTK